MEIDKCLLCGGEISVVCQNHEGFVRGTSYAINCCQRCGTSFASPLKAGSDIYDFIYRNSERLPGYARYHQYAAAIKLKDEPRQFLADAEENYFGVREALLNKVGADAKILEIGSGLGYTTYSLVRAGYDACGIDLSAVAVERATATFGPYYKCASLADLAIVESASYDVIVAMEVIEHVEDPVQFLKEISALLKAGGMLVLSTPRKYRGFQTIWDTDLPPVHLWWFTEEGMNALSKKAGFSSELIDTKAHRINSLNPYTPPPIEFRKKPFVSGNHELIEPSYFQILLRKTRTLIAIVKAYVRRRNAPVFTRVIVAVLMNGK
jgi:SAM-dependent methyltransferase